MARRTLIGSAIVSGGASGLGAATAEALIAEGLTVLLADTNEDVGAATADRLGDAATFRRTDVTDPDDVQVAVNEAAALSEDGLRVSVACAGIGVVGRILSKRGPHDPGLFRTTIEVNLLGTFHLLLGAAQAMVENEPIDGERGVHVSTASVAAFDGQIGQVAYSASKGGVVGLTLPAARDLAQHGIRVNAIAPGIFDTPMVGGLPEAARESLAQAMPFPQRLGLPEEYAQLVVDIARNGYINAETIRLDGAVRLAPR
jgi:3-hydroxyacyl-CoA dehydrogenase / 3-hydroxy-2-methylbutyryl-CoA dehydrogenase